MRIRIIITAALLMMQVMAHSQDNYVISWDYAAQSFDAFVRKRNRGILSGFFYDDKWITDLSLSDYGRSPMLSEVLDALSTDMTSTIIL